MVDYREEGHGWLTFFLNSKAVSGRMRITGTWYSPSPSSWLELCWVNEADLVSRCACGGACVTRFPCVGVFHPRHALQIVVRPRVPEPPCAEEGQELATA